MIRPKGKEYTYMEVIRLYCYKDGTTNKALSFQEATAKREI